MSKRLNLELDLPDEVISALREEDLAAKLKEALVMELVREHHLSQGKAAEILGLNRDELFPLMSHYEVPVVELTTDELRAELQKPFPKQ